jgi:hypothetical protein
VIEAPGGRGSPPLSRQPTPSERALASPSDHPHGPQLTTRSSLAEPHEHDLQLRAPCGRFGQEPGEIADSDVTASVVHPGVGRIGDSLPRDL